MLSRWSASSLPAIVRQPPDGAFSAGGRPGGHRRRGDVVSGRGHRRPPGRRAAVQGRAGRRRGAGGGRAAARAAAAPSRSGPATSSVAVDDRGSGSWSRRGLDLRHAGEREARRGRWPPASPSTPTSSWIVRSVPRASSSSGPAATSRPAAKNPTRSHSDWTWPRMWRAAGDGQVALRDEPAEQREQLLHAGRVDRDRRLVEDERRDGFFTRASAMPSRWRMPASTSRPCGRRHRSGRPRRAARRLRARPRLARTRRACAV